ERLDEHAEALARHAFHGEVGPKAVTYTRAAGAKAFKRSVHREAVAWFEQALEALARLPETPETRAQAIDFRIDLRNALMPLGEVTAVLGHLRAAEALAASLGDRRRQGWVWSYMSACHWVLGSYEPAAEAATRTRALAAELGDTAL